MKKKVSMKRLLESFALYQRTEDGYFEANGLLRQWNAIPGNSQRKMNDYLESPKTKEFLAEVVKVQAEETPRSGISPFVDYQPIKKKRGRRLQSGGSLPDDVWMDPDVFVDFAMWLNPRFKLYVIRYARDGMIANRHLAGDYHRAMCKAIADIVTPEYIHRASIMASVACNWVIFNEHHKDARNDYGTEEQQAELFKLEENIAFAINEGFIKDFDGLMAFLQKSYIRRWNATTPFQFRLSAGNE
jgi:hypothetical protein